VVEILVVDEEVSRHYAEIVVSYETIRQGSLTAAAGNR
jgi:hypothetical protein